MVLRKTGGIMQRFQRATAIFVCALTFSISIQAEKQAPSYKVVYSGGSLPDIKSGAGMRLLFDSKQISVVYGKADPISIPTASITEISYGQDVHRRVGTAIGLAVISLGIGALMALTKSKKHFIGLTWANGDQKGGFAMQCDKNDYRGILAGLEGVTGKKAVDSSAMTVHN
jgi:hypothetical protein